MLSRFLILGLALACAACVTAAPSANAPMSVAQAERPRVILISIDGFHPDYLARGDTPVLSALAAEGASGPMRPSFPSVTFPNHYTLVTGLHPDHHGVVGNNMIDAELGSFSQRNKAAVTDRRWWDGGEPIWVTAENAGLTAAAMFWPGSEADVRGVRPTHWLPFDQSMSGDARVDQLLAWLDLPGDASPDLSTLYFDIVDTAGHRHGPAGEETRQAVRSVDASIGRLVEGLKTRGLFQDTVLVIVSDHGMAATSPQRALYLDDRIDPAAVQIVYSGSVAFLNPVAERRAEVEAALVGSHPHMDCWRKADIPARFTLGTHPRVSQIVCLAEPGWLIATRARPVTQEGGAHGYDHQSPQMQALFIAHGPRVARGRVLSDLDSVDVQPFLARLLGLTVAPGDGRPEDTLPALAR